LIEDLEGASLRAIPWGWLGLLIVEKGSPIEHGYFRSVIQEMGKGIWTVATRCVVSLTSGVWKSREIVRDLWRASKGNSFYDDVMQVLSTWPPFFFLFLILS